MCPLNNLARKGLHQTGQFDHGTGPWSCSMDIFAALVYCIWCIRTWDRLKLVYGGANPCGTSFNVEHCPFCLTHHTFSKVLSRACNARTSSGASVHALGNLTLHSDDVRMLHVPAFAKMAHMHTACMNENHTRRPVLDSCSADPEDIEKIDIAFTEPKLTENFLPTVPAEMTKRQV